MIDPKMLELSVYEGIPHLLAPVVTDMKQAANALRWCVAEMERRYQLMAALGVRNIAGFNRKRQGCAAMPASRSRDPVMMMQRAPTIRRSTSADTGPEAAAVHRRRSSTSSPTSMMIVGKKVEELIARLAQKARASRHPPDPGDAAPVGRRDHRPHQGEHSRAHRVPGLRARWIRARSSTRWAPSRCSATATCCTCRRAPRCPTRVHGAFVSDQEVHRVVNALKTSAPPNYIEEVLSGPAQPIPGLSGEEVRRRCRQRERRAGPALR